MGRKKLRKRHKKAFEKKYLTNKQDEFFIHKERVLQRIHSKLARELFKNLPPSNSGDWTVKTEGITLYYDPEFGSQAEITGTSQLSFFNRLKLHATLLKLLKKGYGILKAVKYCINTLRTQ